MSKRTAYNFRILCQQNLHYVNIHFMTIPANNIVTFYVAMTVYKIIDIAPVLFAAFQYFMQINLLRFL